MSHQISQSQNIKKRSETFSNKNSDLASSHRPSFSTIQRKENILSYWKSLNPTVSVLPIGDFRRFWATAYVCIGASPNKVITIFYLRVHDRLFLMIRQWNLK